ncbi:MAG: hypothetical protein EKK62_03215 [Acidimicrobiia bacterium]|nr:MAG: hypothetical protein EKK62_03215 [Acidimicrobiia bacterium]
MSIEGYSVDAQTVPFSVPWRGSDFALVRATFGAKGEDRHAAEHLARAQTADVLSLGAWHLLRGDATGEGQAEAFWRRTLELEDAFGRLSLGVRVEPLPPPAAPWDLPGYSFALRAFLTRLRELAGRPCAVGGAARYLSSMALPGEVVEAPLWLLDSGPTPPPWERVWIQTATPDDVLQLDRFAGDAADWRMVFGLGAMPPCRAEGGDA